MFVMSAGSAFLATSRVVKYFAIVIVSCHLCACGGGGGGSESNGQTEVATSTNVPTSANAPTSTNSSLSEEFVYNDVTLDLDRIPSAAEQESIDRQNAWFPSALAVAPKVSNGGLPGWYDISTDSFRRFVYPSQSSPLKTDPHYFQFSLEASDFEGKVDNLLDYVNSQTGLRIMRSSLEEIEGYGYVFGDQLIAGFDSSNYLGVSTDWFIDILTMSDGSVLVSLIYAQSSVFDGWNGILMPLVLNGYVSDPDVFLSREVFQSGTYKQKTDFYSAMINTRVLSELGALEILSAEAQQAVSNAVTVAECASASNCSVSYVGGRAVADYD